MAQCRWPLAAWISGNGPLALLAHCRQLTVTLWQDEERTKAEQAKAQIDRLACGGGCYGHHEFCRLDE